MNRAALAAFALLLPLLAAAQRSDTTRTDTTRADSTSLVTKANIDAVQACITAGRC